MAFVEAVIYKNLLSVQAIVEKEKALVGVFSEYCENDARFR